MAPAGRQRMRNAPVPHPYALPFHGPIMRYAHDSAGERSLPHRSTTLPQPVLPLLAEALFAHPAAHLPPQPLRLRASNHLPPYLRSPPIPPLPQRPEAALLSLAAALGGHAAFRWAGWVNQSPGLSVQQSKPCVQFWEFLSCDSHGHVSSINIANPTLAVINASWANQKTPGGLKGSIPWDSLTALEHLQAVDLSGNSISGSPFTAAISKFTALRDIEGDESEGDESEGDESEEDESEGGESEADESEGDESNGVEIDSKVHLFPPRSLHASPPSEPPTHFLNPSRTPRNPHAPHSPRLLFLPPPPSPAHLPPSALFLSPPLPLSPPPPPPSLPPLSRLSPMPNAHPSAAASSPATPWMRLWGASSPHSPTCRSSLGGAAVVVGAALVGGSRVAAGVSVCGAAAGRGSDLSGNRIPGALPAGLSALTALEILSLASNQLADSFPSGLSALTALKHLELGSNTFSGPLPDSWSALSGLHLLDLASAGVLTPPPDSWVALASLEIVSLHSNNLTAPFPAFLLQLPNISDITLFNNSLYGSLPATLWNPTKLTFVEVSSNYLNGSAPQPPAGRSAQFSHSSNCLDQAPSQRPTDQCSRFYSNLPALMQSGTPSPSPTLLGTAARASTPTCPPSCNPVATPLPLPAPLPAPLSAIPPSPSPPSPFPPLLSPLVVASTV
ncbi:unnamed protein product [Closterium sp. NIES-65]|nr:unnamed protein product [Closterium sp. NIES-65]